MTDYLENFDPKFIHIWHLFSSPKQYIWFLTTSYFIDRGGDNINCVLLYNGSFADLTSDNKLLKYSEVFSNVRKSSGYAQSCSIIIRAELFEAWLALTSVKYHDNLLILMLLNQWLALTILRTTGPRSLRKSPLFLAGIRALYI